MRDKLFKALSIISFILGAYWLSEIGQPVEHCHTSRQILGVIASDGQNPDKLGDAWLGCSWWDYVLPRPSLTLESRKLVNSWQNQIDKLKKLEKVLPPLKHPLLVIKNKQDIFAYQVNERRLNLGEEILNSDSLLLRGLVQAWLFQVDQSGLDTFQTEILTDFILVHILDVKTYSHPLSGAPVELTQKRFWPEEAMDFEDYCLSEQVALQHLPLCRDLLSANSGKLNAPSLWSARLYALSELNEAWSKLKPDQVWSKVTSIAKALNPPKSVPIQKIEVTKNSKSIIELLREEVKPLGEMLGVELNLDPNQLNVTHLIDWQAGELSQDFLYNPAFDAIEKNSAARVWLRYKNEFWDLRARRKIKYEAEGQAYQHIIRVQCKSGGLRDPFILNTRELTLIHHCQPADREWDQLFQGKIKKFLSEKKDLAYIKIRPQELKRYLQWYPQAESQSWAPSQWSQWLTRFGVEAKATTSRFGEIKPLGTWDVIEEYRMAPRS